jgi:ferredoxin
MYRRKRKKGCFTINVSDEEWDDNVIAAKNCPVNIIKLKKL